MSEESQEIHQLHADIAQYKKDYQIIDNRKKKIELVCDQVTDWTTKVSSKLNKQLSQGLEPPVSGDKPSMSETFNNITNLVCEQLDRIIEQR